MIRATLALMKVLVLYRPNSEHATMLEAFVRDFKLHHDAGNMEVIDADSRDGSAEATLYGVTTYPAIIVLRDDGSVLQSWEGESLPLMDELAYYTHSQ